MVKNLEIGSRYGRLIVMNLSGKKGNHGEKYYDCQCDCGSLATVSKRHLITGHTKSCGCYHRDIAIENGKKGVHYQSKSRLHRTWTGMQTRCFNPKHDQYHHYGGRGITVCPEWMGTQGFLSFYNWAISNGYSDNLTIDRINNDGDYAPDNCRWANRQTQNNNTRQNRFIEINGEIHTMAEWARLKGIPYKRLSDRVYRGIRGEDLFREARHHF